MTGASPWKWFSRPSAAHVAVSETSSSSRGLRSVLAFYFARRQDGGMCVGVCIVRWGTRRKWQKQRRSLCLPPVLSPYSSTPPSMCCLWIKLIKAPQIRSPEEGGGGGEKERDSAVTSAHTRTHKHSFMNAGFRRRDETQFMLKCVHNLHFGPLSHQHCEAKSP